ncbi:unnamed protein product, partial [Scytosiphon promiscuus]
MSALDLVDDFRALDDVGGGADFESSTIGKLSKEHDSIGELLDRQDETERPRYATMANTAAHLVRDPTPTTAATTPLHAAASLIRDGVSARQKPPGGDQKLLTALEREGLDSSEAWDSADDDEEAWALRSPRERRTVDGTAISRAGGDGATEERSGKPTARGFSSERLGDADDSSSVRSYGSNPNISSPTRPTEDDSDWDRGAGRSSGDDESERPNPRLPRSLPTEFVRQQQSDAATHGAPPVALRRRSDRPSPSPPSPCLHSPMEASSPVSELSKSASGAPSASSQEAEIVIAGSASSSNPQERRRGAASPSQQRPNEQSGDAGTAASQGRRNRARELDGRSEDRLAGDRREEAGPRRVISGTDVELEVAPAEAATISALRSELSTLREHVLRSEREREAQLREFRTRLEAQERRRSPSADRAAEFAATHVQSTVAGGVAKPTPAAFVGGGAAAGTGVREDAGGGGGTPQGAAVHNPFAGTGGGAATTPRDHFPAFEDALLDGGDEEEDARAARLGGGDDGGRNREEGVEGEGGTPRSVLQDEAFDFSIDTLSHINNHTDFGTHAPVAAALPSATPAISPKINGGRDGKGYKGQVHKSRLPWGVAEPSTLDAGGDSKMDVREDEEAEEAFDEKDTAAEEAFFSDACATASLQTPVKHLVAAATAVSGLDVAARRGRAVAEIPTPAARKPSAPFFKGEQGERQSGDADPSTAGLLNSRGSPRSAVGRLSSDSQVQKSPGLCMADFFARASAELDGKVTRGAVAVARTPSMAVFQSAGKRMERSAGVDASCQTEWSFSVCDEVRFVSVPARSPPASLSVRMADGRGCPRGSGDGAEWRGLGSRVEDSSEEALSSGTGTGKCGSIDGRTAPCFTPRQFQPTLCQTPRRCPRRGCAERLSGGAGAASGASSFFDSPNLSPIAVARTRPECSAASRADDAVSAGGGVDSEGGPEGCGDAPPRVTSARRQQRFQGLGHGLSPILSDRGASVSPGGGQNRGGFDPPAGDGTVGASRGWTPARAGVKAGSNASPGRAEGPGSKNYPFSSFGAAPAARGDAVVGSSASGPLFAESSTDVTRSSVLRASSTLNTIAPLDDTGTSLCYSSRTGISFAGELFADSRLRVSSGAERIPRYDVFLPRGDRQPLQRNAGGGSNLAPQPRLAQRRSPEERRRRSRSAPALASGWLPQRTRSEANRIAAAMMAREAPSFGPGGVPPPGVVGAWLAAAIEGMYSHTGAGAGVFDLDPDPGVAAQLPYVCQTPPAQVDRQTVATAHLSEPADSPPPPPPPPEMPLSGDDEEVVDEEDIFY